MLLMFCGKNKGNKKGRNPSEDTDLNFYTIQKVLADSSRKKYTSYSFFQFSFFSFRIVCFKILIMKTHSCVSTRICYRKVTTIYAHLQISPLVES